MKVNRWLSDTMWKGGWEEAENERRINSFWNLRRQRIKNVKL